MFNPSEAMFISIFTSVAIFGLFALGAVIIGHVALSFTEKYLVRG